MGRATVKERLGKPSQEKSLNDIFFHDEIDCETIPGLLEPCAVGLIALDPKHKSHNIPVEFISYIKAGVPVPVKSTDTSQFQTSGIRCDQNDIRSKEFVEGKAIKFEIVLEGQIGLAKPKKKESILGDASLTKLDMAVSKLLADSNRGLDMGMHC